MPGRTAYFGLKEVGKVKETDTVVVSAASGAVGSVVGQMAKAIGCKTIGIAGGKKKCDFVKDVMGLDYAIDYKSKTFKEDLTKACSNGVDIYFENVGGEVSKAVAELLNPGARVPICGFISAYNSFNSDSSKLPETPFDIFGALNPVPEHRFFVVTEFINDWDRATQELTEWMRQGKIKYKETVLENIESAPQGLRDVLSGKNFGKQLIKVSD
jgi:NADPH-dependent curcumin reductase CurA